MAKAKRRKPGRPKGSKNKKAKSSRRKRKATPAQMRALKKAWAARRKSSKASKKTVKKTAKKTAKKMTKKRREQLKANLAKARAARELKNMPKTQRMALKQLQHDMMAETVRAYPLHIPADAPSILHRVRRKPAVTLMSRYN